jgi:hypothetical protein
MLLINFCHTAQIQKSVTSNEHPHPECGFATNFNYKLISVMFLLKNNLHFKFQEDSIHWTATKPNISIKVTFDPILRRLAPTPIYYVAFYGEASKFSDPAEVSALNLHANRILI